MLIEPTTEGLDRVRAYYTDLAARTHDDLADFSDAELAVVLRVLDRVRDNTAAELARLRSAPTGDHR